MGTCVPSNQKQQPTESEIRSVNDNTVTDNKSKEKNEKENTEIISNENNDTSVFEYVPPVEQQRKILETIKITQESTTTNITSNTITSTNTGSKNKNSMNYDTKKSEIIVTTFKESEGWTWGQSHQQMLTDICTKLEIPQVLTGIIESYVFTSAIVLQKTYPKILLHAFKTAIKSTQFGINPKNPLNILIMGAKKVGKTNLVSRYYANAFIKVNVMEGLSTETTRSIIDLDLDDNEDKKQRLYLRLYDTVGFNTITGRYKQGVIRDAHAIMIVFDVSNVRTYEWIAANHIMDQLMSLKFGVDAVMDPKYMKKLPVIMVGSKIDEIDNNIDDSKRKGQHKLGKLSHIVDRVIPINKIKQQYCLPYNASYIEVSSKCCMNIQQLFQITVKEAMTFICNE